MTDSAIAAQTEPLPAPVSEGQIPETSTPPAQPHSGSPVPTAPPQSSSQPRERAPHSATRSGEHATRHSEGADHAPREPRPPRQLREENTIFIGRKSTMGYVLAVVTQFQNGAPEVKIKARGKIISMAVDVAEIVRHKFLPDVKVKDISIQTEDVENEDHTRSKVSSIQIVLAK